MASFSFFFIPRTLDILGRKPTVGFLIQFAQDRVMECANHQRELITYSLARCFEEQGDAVPEKWHLFSVFQIIHGKYWCEVPIIFPMKRPGSLTVCFKSHLQFAHLFLILQQKGCIFLALKTRVQFDFLFGTRDSPRHWILISSQISLWVVNWVIDVYQEGLQRLCSS